MESLFDTLKNMGPGKLVAMLATFFGLILFFIFIGLRSSTPTMSLLYGDLSTADATEMAAKLEASGIDFRLNDTGTMISAPQKDVGKARMLLAQEGLPRKGSFGYEIFDKKQSFGTTSFQQNINRLRALEGELARTIGTIENIRAARVHLVLPEREIFNRDTKQASASVFLSIRNNASVGKEQIYAIQHLVAAAVEGLKANRIAVIDQNGNLLARGEDDAGTFFPGSSNGTDYQVQYEARMARSVEDLIGRIVGYGKVRANVTADLDFDVISRNSESYNPDGQVVRSTQTVKEESAGGASGDGGPVTVENNLPGIGANTSGAGGGGSSNSRTEETTNFEISKTIESLTRETGEVKKLSIAVLVDGRYDIDTKLEKPADAPEDWVPPRTYVPRSQEELDKITTLVKSSVGFDASRGDTVEVINMQFADTDIAITSVEDTSLIFGFPRTQILDLAQTLSLSVVAVLVILLVLKPLATHLAASARAPIDDGMSAQQETSFLTAPGMTPQLGAPGMTTQPEEDESLIDMSAVEGKVKASTVQKVSELVTNHPTETVSVIRQWMSQES